MLDRKTVEDKMLERGFTVYAFIGKTKIQFVSKHMYNFSYKDITPPSQRKPIINVVVDLSDESFKCAYMIEGSINSLNSPECSPVMDDVHFNRVVSKFESQAKWMEKFKRRSETDV